MNTRSPYHLVEFSPWPMFGAISGSLILWGLTAWFHTNSLTSLILGLIMIEMVKAGWWRDVIREETYKGHYTSEVIKSARWGVALFIVSEIMFFFAFFWAFFHSALTPTIEMGCSWPPLGVEKMNPFAVPLLNTAVLLASGVTITWAHHELMAGNKANSSKSLMLTIFLAVYFLQLQMMEYSMAPFSISDGAYGSTFFVMTGFHGFHVALGTTLLIICWSRNKKNQFSTGHLFGLEASAWYWHFVDVVWIFLYICLYWWPN